MIGADSGAGTKCSYFGSYPFAFTGLEGFAERTELLAVETVTEVAAYQQVVCAFHFTAVGAELHSQVEGRVFYGNAVICFFGAASVCYPAGDLRKYG